MSAIFVSQLKIYNLFVETININVLEKKVKNTASAKQEIAFAVNITSQITCFKLKFQGKVNSSPNCMMISCAQLQKQIT